MASRRGPMERIEQQRQTTLLKTERSLSEAAVLSALTGAGNIVEAVVAALQEGIPDDAMRRMHGRVADSMYQAVLEAYQSDVEATRNKAYDAQRQGRNRNYGRLGDAIFSDRSLIVRSTRSGIVYVDKKRLDEVASHWRRLNFGAGLRGRIGGRVDVPVTLGGAAVFRLGFRNRPSKSFSMPEGVFLDKAGNQHPSKLMPSGIHAFVPQARELTIPTLGIRGRNFLNAGLFAYAESFPVELNRMFQDDLLNHKKVRGTKRWRAANAFLKGTGDLGISTTIRA